MHIRVSLAQQTLTLFDDAGAARVVEDEVGGARRHRRGAGMDDGGMIEQIWAAATAADCGLSDPSLYMGTSPLTVVIGSRWGQIKAYSGSTGAELWTANVGATVDATVTGVAGAM